MLKLLVEHDFLLNNFLNEETEVTQQANRMYSFPDGSVVKNLPATARDVGLITGLGRFSGEGNGNPLQYSCLENPMDRGAWRATVHGVVKSRTRLATEQQHSFKRQFSEFESSSFSATQMTSLVNVSFSWPMISTCCYQANLWLILLPFSFPDDHMHFHVHIRN